MVAGLDDGADLPHGFVHPDPVPANAIQVADGGLVVVDWSGAGRGPRLPSLACRLFTAGVRDLRLVDAAVSRYRPAARWLRPSIACGHGIRLGR
jgi:thiamine kinase-like enzyme